jgi:hypothetical protein
MGHSVHIFDAHKLLAHTTPYTWSEILDVLTNSLKSRWRQLMLERITFNSLALVNIPAVSMPIARSLKTQDICDIVLCDKTAHLRVAFYRPQRKVHRSNDHAV